MDSDSAVLAKKLRAAVAQFTYFPRMLRMVWAAAPGWTLAWALVLLVLALLPVATVHLTRLLVDALVAAAAAQGAWEQMRPAMILVASMVGILVLTELLQGAMEWIRAAQSELVQDHVSALVHAQSVAVDLAFYETPEYHDHLHRARYDAVNRPQALLESVGSLLQNGLTLLAMAAVLIPYSPWLPLVLLFSTAPALYVLLRFDWRYHQWWKQTTPDRRRAWYYEWILTATETAAEVRLFSLGPHFESAYQTLRGRLRAERLRLLRSQSLARLGAGFGALLISGAAMAWMVWRTLQGSMSLGDLALFYQAFQRGQNLMRSLLGNLGQIYSHSLFLGGLFEFLGLAPQVGDPPHPLPAPPALREGVRFRNVTFRYPGSKRLALQDFNLTIPAGRVVAIVGANGAGKSTLVKLLCRFYDPEEGSVEVDGLDLRSLKVEEARRLVTVLFQQPVPYSTTAGQNIALGDLAAAPGASAIEAAARGAGAHEVIARLPGGYDTLLGKWFADGTELSGGEWQRIALARAFLRQAPIVALDEPTSFMDSWAEAEWMERFQELVRGRTTLMITHRFTTAMRADIIHVMHGGQIVESGSHAELLARGGLYARSWSAQMQLAGAPELLDDMPVDEVLPEPFLLYNLGKGGGKRGALPS